MNVFISWSGTRSHAVAIALRDWLPLVIQSLASKIWVSSQDINPGTRWGSGIATQLEATKIGIVCVTSDNRLAPWLNFESGALSKTLEKTFVIPYLFDMEMSGLEGPLSQFQAIKASQDGTLSLVKALHKIFGQDSLTEEHVATTFEAFWPRLQKKLEEIPAPEMITVPERSDRAFIQEILDIVRGMARTYPDVFSEQRELLKQLAVDRLAKPVGPDRSGDLSNSKPIDAEAPLSGVDTKPTNDTETKPEFNANKPDIKVTT